MGKGRSCISSAADKKRKRAGIVPPDLRSHLIRQHLLLTPNHCGKANKKVLEGLDSLNI
jgi:hypothetical protein